ncbi:GrrA/OscA1 family cyclophane-containing rSAM-modified RiPP [Geminocystis sp. NIES-3709]|uniref:GrrA/OscA1 family cyclophane-containing rSAM-modified RiPP n=1 Tax=Geminocystis sp. NIES-3709 TaxID=1617448 RepID=UPI0005FC9423|nr:GrrA/OscA1 family cyclophane-containing rSAM-modified RiPP [Geminocystis sp. NIES-3709]BAQ66839.1 hypothetical protein GM3709_3604 [Geminocystis sp. NIES-3709]
MNIKNLTWLGFFLALSSFTIVPKVMAIDINNTDNSGKELNNIENRLIRISESLKAREKELSESEFDLEQLNEILLGRFINGGRNWLNTPSVSFRNNRGPGAFVNSNRGGSGFLNQPRNFLNSRGWRDGGGFWNRGW